MSLEIDVIGETWLALKEYIPQKEKQAAADHLISIIADLNIHDRDLKSLSSTDSYFRRAIQEYIDDEDTSEDDDE
jgi:hypothetical protein